MCHPFSSLFHNAIAHLTTGPELNGPLYLQWLTDFYRDFSEHHLSMNSWANKLLSVLYFLIM